MKQKQSLAGYIRQHLAEIEGRLEVGIRQEVIVSELETAGYETTLKGFRNFLYRARIHAKEKGVKVGARATASTTTQEVKKPQESAKTVPKKPDDPLTKSAGFEYTGTKDLNPDDLI